MGLSYKKNVDDLRESPSLEIINKLYELGANIQFCDPYFEKIPMTRKYSFNIEVTTMNTESIRSADLVLLATDHDVFDYRLIQENANLIVDTRGRLNHLPKVIKA